MRVVVLGVFVALLCGVNLVVAQGTLEVWLSRRVQNGCSNDGCCGNLPEYAFEGGVYIRTNGQNGSASDWGCWYTNTSSTIDDNGTWAYVSQYMPPTPAEVCVWLKANEDDGGLVTPECDHDTMDDCIFGPEHCCFPVVTGTTGTHSCGGNGHTAYITYQWITAAPSNHPSLRPSNTPTYRPTITIIQAPTVSPTLPPTLLPTSQALPPTMLP
eukprot:Hpha_TRINITY_DN22669_c0_g1::TRINITY_DN22669_c0_g1_i1::g.192747::m.192747